MRNSKSIVEVFTIDTVGSHSPSFCLVHLSTEHCAECEKYQNPKVEDTEEQLEPSILRETRMSIKFDIWLKL